MCPRVWEMFKWHRMTGHIGSVALTQKLYSIYCWPPDSHSSLSGSRTLILLKSPPCPIFHAFCVGVNIWPSSGQWGEIIKKGFSILRNKTRMKQCLSKTLLYLPVMSRTSLVICNHDSNKPRTKPKHLQQQSKNTERTWLWWCY